MGQVTFVRRALARAALGLLAASTCLVALVVPVQAAAPTRFSFPVDGSFVDTTTCSFPVLVEVAGTYLFAEHDLPNGDFTLNRRADLTYASTNLDTGTTLLESYWRRQLIRENVEPPVVADDGTITYHDLFIGLFANDRSDGFHLVFAGQLDVYVTIAPDGSVIADVGVESAGQWPSIADSIAAYCEALA